MIKFIVGLLVGGFVGVSWMALCNIVDDIDELAEYSNASNASNTLEQADCVEPEERCRFCGRHLSEVMYDNGKPYRHCYGCHFDFFITD